MWTPEKRASLQIKNAGKSGKKRESSYTVGGNLNLYTHYGEQYGGFLKTKNRGIIWFCNPTPGHISGKIIIKKIHAPLC